MDKLPLIEVGLQAQTFFLSLFAVFFTIVSAYVGGLYFFIGRAPFPFKLLAFFTLTISFLFLSGLSISASTLAEVTVLEWERAKPASEYWTLWGWIFNQTGPFEVFQFGAIVGWLSTTAVYIALFYLTFVYRWPVESREVK